MEPASWMALVLALVCVVFASTSFAMWRRNQGDKQAMKIYWKLHNETGRFMTPDEVKEDLAEFLRLCDGVRRGKCNKFYSQVSAEFDASFVKYYKCSEEFFDLRYRLALQNEQYPATMMPYLDHFYCQQLASCASCTIANFVKDMNKIPPRFLRAVSHLLDKVIDPNSNYEGPSVDRTPLYATRPTVNRATLHAALKALAADGSLRVRVDSLYVKACKDFNQRFEKFARTFSRCLLSKECLSGLRPGVIRRLNEVRVCKQLMSEIEIAQKNEVSTPKCPDKATIRKPRQFWSKIRIKYLPW